MTKFNEEQLSRIMTAHALGELKRGGDRVQGYPCCIIQAAEEDMYIDMKQYYTSGAKWFDGNYTTTWTTEEFLAKLEEVGLA